MEESQRDKLSKKIHEAAKNAQNKVLIFLADREDEDFNSHKYAFKVRAKSSSGLLVKTESKQLKKPDYEINNITDPLGLRVISLFRQDLPNYLDKILGYFGDKDEVFDKNPFMLNSVEEIIIYTNDVDSAEVKKLKVVIQLHEITFSDDQIIKTEQDYSSIHIVGRVNERVIASPQGCEDYNLPVEIQLRTIFEDAWGEIDHLLKYKSESEKEVLSSKFLSDHILTLKKFTDACANYADLINHESMKGSGRKQRSRIYSSMEKQDSYLMQLKSCTIDTKVESYILECRGIHSELREKVEHIDMEAKVYVENRSKLIDELKTLSKNIYRFCKSQKENLCELSKYHLIMEEAHIRLNIGSKSELIKSLSLYNYIERDCRDKSAVYYRKGLAFLSLEMFQDAEKCFLKAKDLAVESGTDSDTTKEYILNALPIQLGITYYYYSELKNDLSQIRLLKQAIDITSEGLASIATQKEEDRKELLVHNNILYYLSKLIEIEKGALEEVYASQRDKSLAFVKKAVDNEETKSIRHIDTLAYALKLKGDLELAYEYAVKAIHIIQEKHTLGLQLTTEDINIWMSNDDIIKSQ